MSANMSAIRTGLIAAALTLAAGPLMAADDAAPAENVAEATDAAPQITLGNGDNNWIITEGATRDGATFTFPEVHIAGNGWLVMHPFEDGKPNGNIYVGHTYVGKGTNKDVEITVDDEPDAGEMFIVMLHSDANEDKIFDFVFVNEREVADKAVFEGTKMIAHPYPAP